MENIKNRVLVTGGAGFIGSNLIQELLKRNFIVTSIDNYSSGTTENHIKGCKYLNLSCENIDELEDKIFDFCFHLASLSRIQPSFDSPNNTFINNTLSTQYICEWCRISDIKLIYAGSSSVWHQPYQSPYATYKYLGEEICKMYAMTFDLKVNIARFYNVYGPNEILEGDMAAVIGKWRNNVNNDLELEIVGDGNQRRDFTHVFDIIDGLIRLMYFFDSKNNIWELGSGKNHSINEVFQLFKKRFGQKANSKHINNQKGNYRNTLRENDSSLTLLDWEPKQSLELYIENLK